MLRWHLRSIFRSVSRNAAQRHGVRKSWQVFHDRSLLLRSFWRPFCDLFWVLSCRSKLLPVIWDIDESPANRRRSVHFRGSTLPPHRRGMGVDAHSAAVNALNGPAIRRRPPMILIKKKKNALYWWRPLRSVGLSLNSDIAFSLKFVLFLFILHCYERIYIYIYIFG